MHGGNSGSDECQRDSGGIHDGESRCYCQQELCPPCSQDGGDKAWPHSKKAGCVQPPEDSIKEQCILIDVKKVGKTSLVMQKAYLLVAAYRLVGEALDKLLVFNAETRTRELPSGCNAEQMREIVRQAYYTDQRGMRQEGAANEGDDGEGEMVIDDAEMPADFSTIDLQCFFEFGPSMIGGLGYEL